MLERIKAIKDRIFFYLEANHALLEKNQALLTEIKYVNERNHELLNQLVAKLDSHTNQNTEFLNTSVRQIIANESELMHATGELIRLNRAPSAKN